MFGYNYFFFECASTIEQCLPLHPAVPLVLLYHLIVFLFMLIVKNSSNLQWGDSELLFQLKRGIMMHGKQQWRGIWPSHILVLL